MKLNDINNFFGDMDLYLMDAILKGLIPTSGSVLDVGCGAGRHAIYFLNRGYDYVGIDSDASQIQLCNFIARSIENSTPRFHRAELQDLDLGKTFDLVICSQLLHFAASEDAFFSMWSRIKNHLALGSIAYITMDSTMDSTLGVERADGLVEYPDGKVRFALTERIMKKMKKGFEEVEPLKTVIYHGQRAQSFLLLRKVYT